MKSEQEQLDLIGRYIDGTAAEEDRNALQDILRREPSARRLYARYANTDATLGSGSIALKESIQPARSARSRWFTWQPLTAAAAGIVFGMFCTSVVFAYVAPLLERVRMLFSESFESGVTRTVPGLPSEARRWAGDEAEVVTSAPEVKPHSGRKMLRFLTATYPGENSPRSQWGDVYRVVDVRGLAGAGRTVARLSASFAQGPVAGEEAFSCSVEAIALDQELGAIPSPLELTWLRQHSSASGSRRLALSAARGWKDVSVEVPITQETQFVLLHLAVVQDQPLLREGVMQFSGQYLDNVKAELISRP